MNLATLAPDGGPLQTVKDTKGPSEDTLTSGNGQPPLGQPAQEPKAPCSTKKMGKIPLALGEGGVFRALRGAATVA